MRIREHKGVVAGDSHPRFRQRSCRCKISRQRGYLQGTETFESGEVAGHVFDQEVADQKYLVSEATCTAKAVYYKSCACGEKGTETFESGEVAGHVFDREVADAKYLVSEATCIAKAVYYKSCACGEKGTETFESGEVAAHVFDREIADPQYLVSEATCTAKAVYYKSCVCGETGTETFEYGEYAAHTLVKTDRVEPTCIENGTEAYWTCSECGKSFSDENGQNEISEPVVIPATGHTYGDWKKDATGHWYECSVCENKKDFAEHTPDKDAPTETEGVVCTVCGYEIQPAAGHEHSPSDVWSADDQYHWHACGGCSQQLDKAAHSGGTASCEAKAVCDVCGICGAHSRQNGKSRSYLRKRRHGSLLDVLGMRQTVLGRERNDRDR